MLKGVIRPMLKNSLGNIKDSSNYREVMISSNLLKFFEYCLLPIIQRYTNVSPMQFGYIANTSTSLAALILKEAVHKYLTAESKVYSCFLDLSKAFGRVNYDMLLQKLQS